MKARGHLIVFEGIDGSGKSTQARLLAAALGERGGVVHLSQEPTQGKWGRQVRDSGVTGRLSAQEELDLFHRYYFSTMAYQGARGFDPAVLRELNEAFAPAPDLLFIFDLEIDAALARVGGRGATTEFEQREGLARCREIFLTLKDEDFAHVVAANRPPEELHAEVMGIVARRCPELLAER
jgi:dTMP kinase